MLALLSSYFLRVRLGRIRGAVLVGFLDVPHRCLKPWDPFRDSGPVFDRVRAVELEPDRQRLHSIRVEDHLVGLLKLLPVLAVRCQLDGAFTKMPS